MIDVYYYRDEIGIVNQQPKIQVAEEMDLSQYKMIRSNKFPLPKVQQKSKPNSAHTIALVSVQQPELYQIHIEANNVIMFNEHEYLRRQFTSAHRLLPQSNEAIVKQLMQNLKQSLNDNDNNLVIFNALDLTPIDELIFPWRQFVKYNSDPDKNTGDEDRNAPQCAIKTLLSSVLEKKRNNSVITLSVIAIRSDGSLEDELNYEWIEESKFIEDLMKIKKTKLKVKKYKSEVKIFDLNRQQIKQWAEAEEILYHYSQIKQYLESWKQELEPKTNPKIGELYEVCEMTVDEELGFIKKVHRRKCLIKFYQFLPQSNLIMMKVNHLLKQAIQNVAPTCARDFQLGMFLKDYFEQPATSHYTLLTQIGTNQSLKQQVICLNMDLQFPGLYSYFKNYCDKPDLVEEVRRRARIFSPITPQQKSQIKVASIEHSINKLKPKSINALKQGEIVASKSFCFETFSSNEKKKPNGGNTFQVQTALQDRKNTFEPYQYQKPATGWRATEHDRK